ncbi:MAG: hypothetical protein U1E73_01560 [Planctomycetota bacterium]
MNWSLKGNAVGLVRVGLLALLFSAVYPMWLAFRFHQAPIDVSTMVFRCGLFFIALGAAIKSGMLHEGKPSDAAARRS